MTRRRLGAFLAAALIGAAAGQVLAPAADATSGYCTKGTGATVVVDRGALGGGTSIGCDPNGANTAGSTVVPRAGFALTYVQGSGFVCKVVGLPSSQTCQHTPPSDAYWGLFWSDGTSGTWNYSSTGIGGLKVPAGGFIGWKWQNSSTRSQPGPAPISTKSPSPSPTPKPSPKPSPKPTSAPEPTAGTPSGAGGGTAGSGGKSGPAKVAAKRAARVKATEQQRAARKAAVKAAKRVKASASPSATASTPAASATPDASTAVAGSDLASGERATGSSSPLPLVGAGALVLLLASVGATAWRRRKG